MKVSQGCLFEIRCNRDLIESQHDLKKAVWAMIFSNFDEETKIRVFSVTDVIFSFPDFHHLN